jgi:hypothetical protein
LQLKAFCSKWHSKVLPEYTQVTFGRSRHDEREML